MSQSYIVHIPSNLEIVYMEILDTMEKWVSSLVVYTPYKLLLLFLLPTLSLLPLKTLRGIVIVLITPKSLDTTQVFLPLT